MSQSNPLQVAKTQRIAGGLIVTGTLIIVFTIVGELQLGWIGSERPRSSNPEFMQENWSRLASLWAWQVGGHLLLTLAYLLRLKHAEGLQALLWGALLLSGILISMAFLALLGGYPPALASLSENRVVFDTFNSGLGTVYQIGRLGGLLWLPLFLMATFGRDAFIGRPLGIATVAIVISTIALGTFTGLDIKVTGASWFLMPLVLGLSLLKSPFEAANTSRESN